MARPLPEATGTEAADSAPSRPIIQPIGELFDHLFEERTTTRKDTTVEGDRYHLRLWRRELGQATLVAGYYGHLRSYDADIDAVRCVPRSDNQPCRVSA